MSEHTNTILVTQFETWRKFFLVYSNVILFPTVWFKQSIQEYQAKVNYNYES